MKKMFFILVIILSSFVYAEDQIFSSDSAIINLDISSTIDLKKTGIHPEVNEVNALLYLFPRKYDNQDVKNIQTSPSATLERDKITFKWNFPKDEQLEFSYNADIYIDSKFDHVYSKVSYPSPYELFDLETRTFTKSSEHIDSDNLNIQQLARNLAEGETDQWIVVSKIGFWIKNNVKYDLSTLTADVNQKASWVLQNKQGVCDEITNLFIAMLRSVGIPARFVTGLVYTNDKSFSQSFVPHGWAEVYFQQVGWVPFDITYGQFGWVDTSHIKFKDSNDISGLGYETLSRAKELDIIPNQLSFKAKINEVKGSNKDIILKSNIFKNKVGHSSLNLIEIEIENLRDYYVSTEIFLTKVNEFESIEDNTKQIILEPKEKKRIIWKIKVKDNLDLTKLYEMPVVIYTSKNETSKNLMEVSINEVSYGVGDISKETVLFLSEETKTYSQQLDADCKTEKQKAHVSEEREITCDIKNKGDKPLKYLSVCIERDCKDVEVDAKSKSSVLFNKYFDKGGFNEVLLTINSKDISKKVNFYCEALDDAKIEISQVNYPELVESNQVFNLSFTLVKKSYSVPKDIKVELQNLRKEALITQPELKNDQPFEFILSSDQIYDDTINIVINYKDEFGHSFQEKKEINININQPGFFGRIINFFKAFWNNIVDTFT